MANIKETDLYQPIKEWLESDGYSVYPEVELGLNRADVVGIKEGDTVIVELKTSLSLELIAQGVEWVTKKCANKVFIAAPMPMRDVHWYASKLVSNEGLGLLLVNLKVPSGLYFQHNPTRSVRKWMDPRELVTDKNDIRKAITEYHGKQEIEGGHSGGGYITEYRVTMLRIREFLEKKGHKWTSLDEVVLNCPTHYTGNVRASVSAALQKFEHDWCEYSVIKRKGHVRLKPGVKKSGSV